VKPWPALSSDRFQRFLLPPRNSTKFFPSASHFATLAGGWGEGQNLARIGQQPHLPPRTDFLLRREDLNFFKI